MTSKKVSTKEKKFPKFKGKNKEHYDRLMNSRKAIMGQIVFHTEEALNFDKGSSGERAGMSSHMADLGSDNFRHDMELALLTTEGEAIGLIDEAIERLQTGEYGICLDCAATISDARLEAKPYAYYCIKCKSIRETNGGFRPDYDEV